MTTSVEWYPKIKDQSLGLAVREAGFDLTMFNNYPKDMQDKIRRRAIKITMRNIAYQFKEVTKRYLYEIKQGVYVISISTPFTIGYKIGHNEVIYIGRGNISNRLESHFNHSLFDFMLSVSGSNFDFYLTEPQNSSSESYYKHIEYMLLSKFRDKHDEYPLLNKNAGSKQEFDDPDSGWDKPIKGSGKKRIWELRATNHCGFAKLG